jgi:uncharacterized protein YhaN
VEQKIKGQQHLCKLWTIFSILSLLAIISIGSCAFIFNAVQPWIISVPIVSGIISVLLMEKSSKMIEDLEELQNELIQQREKQKSELENFQRIDKILNQQLISLADRMAKENIQHEQLIIRLKALKLSFKPENVTALENELDKVSENIAKFKFSADMDLNLTEKELVENILESGNNSELLKLAELKEFITAQIHKKKVEAAMLDVSIKKSESTANIELIEDEIAKLTRQKISLEQRGEALGIAIKVLEEATNDVQKKYIPIMNKVLNGTFSTLTGQRYSDIRAGENLSIMLSDPDTENVVPVTALSSGTIDQSYLALRIAISETVLRRNEGLPFIMDEPFAQYDDERTENTLKCIYEISKRQQVIIFTCKQREVDLISSQYPCKICSLTYN